MDLVDVYRRLLGCYGPQHWWPGTGGFETVAGAILTQHASWQNAELALNNLRAAGALAPEPLARMDVGALAMLVRPAGCFQAKARSLSAMARLVTWRFGGSLDACLGGTLDIVRGRLLSVPGIGPETADAILLYAGGHTTFVVDAYARRVLGRLGTTPTRQGYEDWRSFFMSRLPDQSGLYAEYHALLVRHGKERCRARPRCASCPLRPICAAQQSSPLELAAASQVVE